MPKKILIAVGGSGGHVFPAFSLAQKLKSQSEDLEIVFAGGGLGDNKFIDRRAFRCVDIPCGKVLTRNPWQMLFGAVEMGRGILHSRELLQELNPDLVVGFGSYHSFPLLAAAKLSSRPFVLHAADSIPGKVVRLFSRWALCTGIHFPEASNHLKGLTLRVGIPLREHLSKGAVTKEQAAAYYGLDPLKPIILVFGGSQGARRLNNLLIEALPHLSNRNSCQFLHFAGREDAVASLERGYAAHQITAHVKAFETRMDFAWNAATIALTRSGASTIAELVEFAVPSILVPFPQAADRHQERNASYAVQTIKGAVMVKEDTLDGPRLAAQIDNMLQAESLQEKIHSLQDYKNKQNHQDFSKIVQALL